MNAIHTTPLQLTWKVQRQNGETLTGTHTAQYASMRGRRQAFRMLERRLQRDWPGWRRIDITDVTP